MNTTLNKADVVVAVKPAIVPCILRYRSPINAVSLVYILIVMLELVIVYTLADGVFPAESKSM